MLMGGIVGNVDYEARRLVKALRKVGRDPSFNQPITFAGFLGKALSIDHDDLASANLNKAIEFELAESVCNGWSLYP